MIRALLLMLAFAFVGCAKEAPPIQPLVASQPVSLYWDELHQSREEALLAQRARGFLCAYQASAPEGLREGTELYLDTTRQALWGQNLLRWGLAIFLGAFGLFLVAVSFAELTPKRAQGPLERLALIFGLQGFSRSRLHLRGELAAAAAESARQLEAAFDFAPTEQSVTLNTQARWLRELSTHASSSLPFHPSFSLNQSLEQLRAFARLAREYRFALEHEALKPEPDPILGLPYLPSPEDEALAADAAESSSAKASIEAELDALLEMASDEMASDTAPVEVASAAPSPDEASPSVPALSLGDAATPATLALAPPTFDTFAYVLPRPKPFTPFDRFAELSLALSLFAWAMWVGLGTLPLIVPGLLSLLTLALWGFRLVSSLRERTPSPSKTTLLLRTLAVALVISMGVVAPQGSALQLGYPLAPEPFVVAPQLPWPSAHPDFQLPEGLRLDAIRQNGPPSPEFGPSTPELGPPVPEVGPEAPEVGPEVPEVGPSVPEVGPETPELGPPIPPVGPPPLPVPDEIP